MDIWTGGHVLQYIDWANRVDVSCETLKFPCPQNIYFNAMWFLPLLGLAWLMMTKRLTSMSVASAGLPGALIEAQTKEPNFT